MIGLVGDHLWQSTLFALAIALLTLAFRRQDASVRHGLWLAASLKFVIPFSALTAIGEQFAWLVPFRAVRVERVMMLATGTPPPGNLPPFDLMLGVPVAAPQAAAVDSGWLAVLPVTLAAIWFAGVVAVLAIWCVRWHRLSRIAAAGVALTEGREVEMLRRHSPSVPMRLIDTTLEPGIFGIVRPVLLWPRGISEHLTDEQIDAILAHELAHVRRRDNLFAAAQMVVQAVFWFHPLVWWIGSRLVDERERACDEDVIRRGSRPHVYAESILRTCQFYVEAPVACAAGVTGADLKRRIEQIVRNHAREPLGRARKAMLGTAAALACLVPVVSGALTAPPLRAQEMMVTRTLDARVRQLVVHRPDGPFRIVSRTGLDGPFDLKVGFLRGPDLFHAMEEQLGLRLEEQNAPVDVLVIERVARPE